MAELPVKKIKEEDLSVEKAPGLDLSDIISQTIQKTLEGLAPYLNRGGAPDTSLKEQGENIRSRIISEMNKDFDHVLNANRKYLEKLAATPESEMTVVQIPRVYAKYLGSVLPVGLNGSIISIPINNKPYAIPKVMKAKVQETLEYEDEKISFMERTGYSDVTETTQDRLKI